MIFFQILSNPDTTPELVFSLDGALVANYRHRSVWGALSVKDQSIDSSTLFLPIGFQASFQDPDFDIVIFGTGRPYDAVLGRYMSINVEDMLKINIDRLWALNPYDLNNNDPINLPKAEIFPLDLTSWLNVLGINLDNMAATAINSDAPFSCDSQESNARVKSALSCHLDTVVRRLDQDYPKSTVTQLPSFGNFVTTRHIYSMPLEIDQSDRLVILDNAKPESITDHERLFYSLLNNSQIIDHTIDDNGRYVDILWKNMDRFEHDFVSIGFLNADDAAKSDLPALDVVDKNSANARKWSISNLHNNGKLVRLWNDYAAIELEYSNSPPK